MYYTDVQSCGRCQNEFVAAVHRYRWWFII